MTIAIYNDKYKVKHTYTYTYESETDDDYMTKTETEEIEISGHEFLRGIVSNYIKQKDFFEISFENNVVHIGFFDPMTGHTEDHTFEFEQEQKEGERE